jgi:hypothetical protein
MRIESIKVERAEKCAVECFIESQKDDTCGESTTGD